MPSTSLPIYTLDAETDPFKAGRKPMPFAWGLYDGQNFVSTWGKHSTKAMRKKVEALKPGIIFMHNGGRFDIYYIMDWVLGNPMRIINGRIAKAEMRLKKGKHEIRDSYSIMPIALGSLDVQDGKLEMDYALMESGVRNKPKNKAIILEYLERDVVFLHKLCTEFIAMFGLHLTIGGTAMGELRQVSDFERLTLEEDKSIRGYEDEKYVWHPGYYLGGRVECFEGGMVEGDLKLYDVNSMYPSVMKNALHPTGKPYYNGNTITKHTCFIHATGWSRGAFPQWTKEGLRFTHGYGEFYVTRHEWDMAEELGLFKVDKVLDCHEFEVQVSFEEFVDKFYKLKKDAEIRGDRIQRELYKLIANSSYGKFGQNYLNYCESRLTDAFTVLEPNQCERCTNYTGALDWQPQKCMCWRAVNLHEVRRDPEKCFIIWERPSMDETLFNVATGASITGAARAVMMRAIHFAKRPIYCDTDSLLCEGLPFGKVSQELGEWKLEAECTRVAVGGRKLYAMFEDRPEKIEALEVVAKLKRKVLSYADGGVCVKQANKGVKISAEDIVRVCRGEVVMCQRDAPSFKLDGSYVFIEREVRMTI